MLGEDWDRTVLFLNNQPVNYERSATKGICRYVSYIVSMCQLFYEINLYTYNIPVIYLKKCNKNSYCVINLLNWSSSNV